MKQSAMDILERWMAPHATRHIIRRTMDGLDSNVHDVSSPRGRCWDEPQRNAELPCALFSLTHQGVIRVFNFRSERITHIEPTDLLPLSDLMNKMLIRKRMDCCSN